VTLVAVASDGGKPSTVVRESTVASNSSGGDRSGGNSSGGDSSDGNSSGEIQGI